MVVKTMKDLFVTTLKASITRKADREKSAENGQKGCNAASQDWNVRNALPGDRSTHVERLKKIFEELDVGRGGKRWRGDGRILAEAQ